MHYSVDYSKFTDMVAKRNCALEDIKQYLGERKFNEVTQIARDQATPFTWELFEMAASFAGIHGYPARAWYEHAYHLEGA